MLSLTFDDGLECHLRHVIPALNERGLKATFFLIGKQATSEWRDVAAMGHEIGSHSLTHARPEALLVGNEARESKEVLETLTGAPVTSFCYPHTDAPGFLQAAVQKAGYLQARGGSSGDPDNYYNLPAVEISGRCIAHVETHPGWVTLMFHGVGDSREWGNVELDDFCGYLDYLNPRHVYTFHQAAEILRS